jgi:hypothetical protein
MKIIGKRHLLVALPNVRELVIELPAKRGGSLNVTTGLPASFLPNSRAAGKAP